MKYVLIVYICSLINQSCPESLIISSDFNQHKDCAMAGYDVASRMLKDLDDDLVNENKLAIKFECREVKVHTVPPPKPKIKA